MLSVQALRHLQRGGREGGRQGGGAEQVSNLVDGRQGRCGGDDYCPTEQQRGREGIISGFDIFLGWLAESVGLFLYSLGTCVCIMQSTLLPHTGTGT